MIFHSSNRSPRDPAPLPLVGLQSGVIVREIIDDAQANTTWALKSTSGTIYYAQYKNDDDPNRVRNALLDLSLQRGLQITASGDATGYLTAVTVASQSAAAATTPGCGSTTLTDTRAGLIQYITDSDAAATVGYTLETSDGTGYCLQLDSVNFDVNNRLLTDALTSGVGVTATANANGVLASFAVGQ